jgi:hypothetical protein
MSPESSTNVEDVTHLFTPESDISVVEEEALLKRQKKFFKHINVEKQLSASEESLLDLTEVSARRHGFDNLLAYLSGRRIFKMVQIGSNLEQSHALFRHSRGSFKTTSEAATRSKEAWSGKRRFL